MEAEARKLLDVLANQTSQGMLTLDTAMLEAIANLEDACETAEVQAFREEADDMKSRSRELARMRRLDDGAILIDVTQAHKAAYGSGSGTL